MHLGVALLAPIETDQVASDWRGAACRDSLSKVVRMIGGTSWAVPLLLATGCVVLLGNLWTSRSHNSALKEGLSRSSVELQTAHEEGEICESELKQASDRVSKAQVEVGNLKSKNDVQAKENARLKQELDGVKKRVAVEETEKQKAFQENAAMQADIKLKLGELAELNKEIKNLETVNKAARRQIAEEKKKEEEAKKMKEAEQNLAEEKKEEEAQTPEVLKDKKTRKNPLSEAFKKLADKTAKDKENLNEPEASIKLTDVNIENKTGLEAKTDHEGNAPQAKKLLDEADEDLVKKTMKEKPKDEDEFEQVQESVFNGSFSGVSSADSTTFTGQDRRGSADSQHNM